MPSESDQASVYLAGAQVGRDNAQPIWKKEVRDTELISEYKQFQEKKSKKKTGNWKNVKQEVAINNFLPNSFTHGFPQIEKLWSPHN